MIESDGKWKRVTSFIWAVLSEKRMSLRAKAQHPMRVPAAAKKSELRKKLNQVAPESPKLDLSVQYGRIMEMATT
ncbi:unnamed protein product [Nesidiocoris tenuis]|uniref:Uncharacterized protein n=1 Tax=Nesidiocoris tenuis TaxID=355587 RepID=A0A6H5GKT2_9HEMI|nr:unnamed protein product [Nesidiocoris tenuis]